MPPGHKAHADASTLQGNQTPDNFLVSTANTLSANRNPWAVNRMHASSVGSAMQTIGETKHCMAWYEGDSVSLGCKAYILS